MKQNKRIYDFKIEKYNKKIGYPWWRYSYSNSGATRILVAREHYWRCVCFLGYSETFASCRIWSLRKKNIVIIENFFSHNQNLYYTSCWGSFLWNPNVRKEAQPSNIEKLAKDREQKSLSPSGRNNGSQVHEISKWALRKQMSLKEPGKREIVSSKPMCCEWCEKK